MNSRLWVCFGASWALPSPTRCSPARSKCWAVAAVVPPDCHPGCHRVRAVLLNIVVLNLCYDVPVKIYSINLFCQATLHPGSRPASSLECPGAEPAG